MKSLPLQEPVGRRAFLHRLGAALWIGLILLVVVLAAYVSVGRLLAVNIGPFRDTILSQLNSRLPFDIGAQDVSGEWRGFTPVLVMQDLRLSTPEAAGSPLRLRAGRVDVDVLASLRTLSLQFSRVALDGLRLDGTLDTQGRLYIAGLSDSGDGGDGSDSAAWLRTFLLNIAALDLRDNRLRLQLPDGERQLFRLNLKLQRDGSERRVAARLVSTAGADISVQGEGVGDPFSPEDFAGALYVDMRAADLSAVRALAPGWSPAILTQGQVDLQLWFDWQHGQPRLTLRSEADALVVAAAAGDWQLPLQRVALDARLARERDRWTMYASGVEVVQGDAQLTLPDMQLDTWEDALRLRAADVPVAGLAQLAANLELLPQALREVFAALAPAGRLDALQLSIGNLREPGQDFEVEANFSGLGVAAWSGAPGVRGARGYVRLGPDGGRVILDSEQLELAFPQLFPAPLHFDELYGDLGLSWDAHSVHIDSGLLSARGEEGSSRVLFGLEVPVGDGSDREIGMDLLVTLGTSHPRFRDKFLPQLLDDSLRDWLASSIGDGRIESGAFLWHGSLAAQPAVAPTVQLGFNVADTDLTYHPDWPAVHVQEGVVLIDDTRVSIWAERARLLGSAVRGLSVETWVDRQQQLLLAVDARIQGPAADGLAVVNTSPLAEPVKHALDDWELSGDLATDLNLRLNLSDAQAPPVVELATHWQAAQLRIAPGDLLVTDISGRVDYRSAEGFSSPGLTAALWGRPVQLALLSPAEVMPGQAGSPALDIRVDGSVAMSAVRDRLDLPQLAFADGESAAAVTVRVQPGEAPLLRVDSTLEGIALDLPLPWRKSADTALPLRVSTTLDGDTPLLLSLGDGLQLSLGRTRGQWRGAALGIGQPAGEPEPGLVRIGGRMPRLDVGQWQTFAARDEFAGDATSSDAPDGSAMPWQFAIDQLRIDQLVLAGRTFNDAVVTAAQSADTWQVAIDTDWLQGRLSLARGGGDSQLVIGRLDLAALQKDDPDQPDSTDDTAVVDDPVNDPADGPASADATDAPSDPNEPLLGDVPAIDVVVENLFWGERRLGALRFVLAGADGVLTAEQITGDIAGLRLDRTQPGRLRWQQGAGARTTLLASLRGGDLGDTLAQLGYQRVLTTRQTGLELALSWPGGPNDFALAASTGTLGVELGPGSFLEASAGASGALRVVSAVNLADIVRRLSLAQLVESGIPFDRVQGDIALRDGLMTVQQMQVEGGSSFQFSGSADIASRRLDGELVVTLPVAGNLPWMAALAASLPVAAGVFLVSQMFDDQVRKLGSAVYRVDGHWDDPQLDVQRIFTDAAGTAAAKPPPAEAQPAAP